MKPADAESMLGDPSRKLRKQPATSKTVISHVEDKALLRSNLSAT